MNSKEKKLRNDRNLETIDYLKKADDAKKKVES